MNVGYIIVFKNCASKIKNIAKALFIADVVLILIGFAVTFLLVNDLVVVFVYAISAPVQLFVTYVACLIIYGFGKIVDNTGK